MTAWPRRRRRSASSTPGKLVIASHNEGKVREIRDLLAPFGMESVSAAELDLPEPEETGTTFVANAELKAMQAADLSGLPALADDSGLCVDALGGDPGVFTARWADDAEGCATGRWRCEGRGRDRRDRPRRRRATRISSARWRSPGPTGTSSGSRVGSTARSSGRHAATTASAMTRCSCRDGHDQTFGEMDPEAKHAISHRADAFAKLVAAVF